MANRVRAASAISRHPQAVTAATQACQQALLQAHMPGADWAIVFASSHYFSQYAEMLEVCAEILGTEKICGGSASGVLTEAGEINFPPAVAVLAVSSEAIRMTPFCMADLSGCSRQVAEEIIHLVPEGATDLIIFPDIFQLEVEAFFEVLNFLNDERPQRLNIVGGSPSSEIPTLGTAQFCGTRFVQGGVSGFYLQTELRGTIGVSQACYPFTSTFEVTNCEGRWLLELNGRSALEVMREALPGGVFNDPRQLMQSVFLAVTPSPETTFERGNYLIRNIAGIDLTNEVITCSGVLEKGVKVAFASRDEKAAREDMKALLQTLKNQLQQDSPQLGFYFNCCARGHSLYGFDDIDTSYIQQTFNHVPLIGLSSFAEIGPVDAFHRLQTYSGVLLLI